MGPLEVIDAIAKAIELNPWFQVITLSLQVMGVLTLIIVGLAIHALVSRKDYTGEATGEDNAAGKEEKQDE
jgi:cytochrome c-type biogenesis protein CcmH/NrfF